MSGTHVAHRNAKLAPHLPVARKDPGARANAAQQQLHLRLQIINGLLHDQLPRALNALLGGQPHTIRGLDHQTLFVRVAMQTSWTHWPHDRIPMDWDASMHVGQSIIGRYRWTVPGTDGKEKVDVQLTGPPSRADGNLFD